MGWYFFVGALAAFGGFCLLWVLFGWLLPSGREGVLVLPGRPGEGELPTIRRYLWLRELGSLTCRLVVVDLGLGPREGQWLEAHGIEIISPGEIGRELGIGAEEIDRTGNGDPPGYHQCGGVSKL